MPSVQLKSTAIRSLGYDPKTKSLVVHFTSGGSETYSGIAEATFNAFVNAPSAGKFFHSHIKNK